MNVSPSLRALLVCAATLTFIACGDSGDGDAGGPTVAATGNAEAFADLDGLIVRQANGPTGGIYVLDPRTGALSPPYLQGATEGMIRGVAGSPDGLHVAVQTDQSLTIGRLDNTGPTPTFETVVRRGTFGASGFVPVRFNRNGEWVVSAGRVFSVPQGDVIDCDGERAQLAWASPDGRHVILTCPGDRLSEERIYRDRVLVWRGSSSLGVGLSGNGNGGSHRLSQDGEWVYTVGSLARERPALHLPTATLATLSPFGGAAIGGSIASDRQGRWVNFGAGGVGDFCDLDVAAPADGSISDVHGAMLDDTGTPTIALPLGNVGAFLSLPAGFGLWVNYLGLDEAERHAFYGGAVTFRGTDTNGNCQDQTIGEVRVRRMPVGGGPPDDFSWPYTELVCPVSATVPREPWDSPTTLLAVAGDQVMCGGAFPQPGIIARDDDARLMAWTATLVSPGRRAAISIQTPPGDPLVVRVKAVCLERLDADGVGWCYDDGIAESWPEMDVWTGWAAPGAGGFAGPAVYAVSHEAAPAGAEVTVFGAGLDGDEPMRIGDRALSRGELLERTAHRVTFRMPADAPTEPAEIRFEGGPDVFAHTVYRETALWAPAYQIPDRIPAPYGTLLIPISPAPPADADVEFVTNLAELVPDGIAFRIDERVTDEGIELTLPTTLPAQAYWLHVHVGDETHAVVLDVDGTTGAPTTEWQRLDFGIPPIDTRLVNPLFEAGGIVALGSSSAPRALLPSGLAASIADGAEMFAGRWTYGAFGPFVVRDDFRMQQLVGFAGSDTVVSATYVDYPPLHTQITDAIATAEFGWAYGVDPGAEIGIVAIAYRNEACAFGVCAQLWSFDLTNGVPTLVADDIPVLAGFLQGSTTSAGLHLVAGNDPYTFPSADVGAVEALTGVSLYTYQATTWGWIGFEEGVHRASIWRRDDAAAGFVDLDLDEVVTVGTSRDGTLALVGTANGEVRVFDGTAASASSLLEPPAGWPFAIESGLDATWLTVTDDGRLLWLVQSGNPILYLRTLGE